MKMVKTFISTFLLVMLLQFLLMTVNTMRELPESILYNTPQEYFTILIQQLVIVFALLGLLVLAVKKKLYEYLWAWVIPAVLLVLLQALFYIELRPLALWDTLDVANEALRMVLEHDHHISSAGGYFEMYGNNYFAVYFLYLYYSLLHLFSVEAYWEWTVLLAILCIDGAIILSCRFAYLLKGAKTAYLCFLLWVIHPYPYILGSFAYTSTFSFFLIALELHLILLLYRAIRSGEKRKAQRLSLWLGMVGAFSFLLRATNLIILIAAAVLLPLALPRCREERGEPGKGIWKTGLIFLLSFLVIIGTYRIAERSLVPQELREKNFPIQHWLAMGLNQEREGRYFFEDEQETRQLADKEAKIALAKSKIRDRLERMSGVSLILHMNRKLTEIWCGVSQYYYSFLTWNTSYGGLYSHVAGPDSSPIIAYNLVLQLLLYVFLLVGVLRRYCRGQAELSYLLLVVTIFGVNLFYMLWEVSYRYSTCFMPIVFFLSADEMEEISGRDARFFSKLAGIPIILLLLIGSYKIPWDEKSISDLRCYSIYSQRYSERLYVPAEGERVCQSFTVPKDKSFNQIDFLMAAEEAEISSDRYRLRLYTAGEEQLLADMEFGQEFPHSYYHSLPLKEVYGEGEYVFVLDQISGHTVHLPFRKIHNLFGDYNPKGMLVIDGDAKDGKWDLIFDVLYVS